MISDEQGEPVRLVGTAEDVTDREKAESRLLAHSRQQAATVALGQIALESRDSNLSWIGLSDWLPTLLASS